MKLATLADGTRDGRVVLISRDLARAMPAPGAATMQEVLERWTTLEPTLRAAVEALEAGTADGAVAFVPGDALAPLPRAWQWLDGSAFESHGRLMQKVFELAPNPSDRPLMYQGISDRFLAAHEDVSLPSEGDGIDFEGEFGVIVDEVPMGATPEQAAGHIRLLVLINDWSLRRLAPIEMKTGFGWVQAKPRCSIAPVAVTPDELGARWRDGRVDLPLRVDWNGKPFGAASGYAMGFSFPELVVHAAYSRPLCAGTLIGSGTVSNDDFREVGSSCIAERRGIELLDTGAATTSFMHFGDRVAMEAHLPDGGSVFGRIDQKVVASERSKD